MDFPGPPQRGVRGMSEKNYVDASGMEPTEIDGYITNQVLIRRILTSKDADRIYVDWPEDASLLELVGMLEFAKTVVWNYYMETAMQVVDDDEEEEGDD